MASVEVVRLGGSGHEHPERWSSCCLALPRLASRVFRASENPCPEPSSKPGSSDVYTEGWKECLPVTRYPHQPRRIQYTKVPSSDLKQANPSEKKRLRKAPMTRSPGDARPGSWS